MSKNNYPQSALDNIEPEVVQAYVSSLKELHDLGKPKTDEETKQRIDQYFELCERSSLRPGVESLSMALHVSRITLYRWSMGEDCSPYKTELIQSAKSVIFGFLEQCLLSGKINPASGIFLAKNWLGYRDSISIEESVPFNNSKTLLGASELPKLGNTADE